ncbi:uncharacterized protein F54H12.2-like [Gigantopelta aegis]|uniref:uncharacterized protein F54H12.2-like n=1 Tax=Gigantopelta aegis TaxID=1735272 RepID=UPI001B8895D4|nr:uncharacterized protein F54H12.2-like [Gigantopelta aegis]
MASYMNKAEVEAHAEELSIFELPRTFTSVEKIYYEDTRPTSQITTENSPVEFNVYGQGIDYIDLKRTKLHVKAKIVKADGSALVKDEKVGPINLWLQSLWSQVDLTLNGKLITTSTNLYPYKSYLKVLLNGTSTAKESSLQSQLYYKDTTDGNTLDGADPINGINSGLVNRGAFCELSHTVGMKGPLCEDFLDIKRYLINGVNLQIKLFRTRPSFHLMAGEDNPDYKVKIEDVYLRVCKVRPNTAIITAHAKTLQNTEAIYPFTRSDIKVASIPRGQLSFHWDHLFQNKCPNKVVVALVSAEAVNGSYTKNPFNFAMYDLDTIALYVNGESLPAQPLHVNNNQYISAYNNLFEGRESIGLDVSRDDFGGGYALYQFTLEPFHLKDGYLDLIKRGNLRLDLQFKKALPETVNCLIYSEDNLLLQIDGARNILYAEP